MKLSLHYNSPVILTYSIICIIVFYLDYYLNIGLIRNWFSLTPTWGWGDISYYPTLFTYILGHADANHLWGNLSLLLLLGPIIEERYGSKNLLIMIALTAFISGLLNILLFDTGILGASGIVFMLIILVSITNTASGRIPLTFVVIVILYLGREVVNATAHNSISEFVHIAGGILGSVFGFMSAKGGEAPTKISEL